MNSSEQILAIILSAALAVFLVLGIVALVKFIQVLDQIKALTKKAEAVADKVDNIGSIFEKTAAPLAIGRLIAGITRAVKGKSHRKRRESDE